MTEPAPAVKPAETAVVSDPKARTRAYDMLNEKGFDVVDFDANTVTYKYQSRTTGEVVEVLRDGSLKQIVKPKTGASILDSAPVTPTATGSEVEVVGVAATADEIVAAPVAEVVPEPAVSDINGFKPQNRHIQPHEQRLADYERMTPDELASEYQALKELDSEATRNVRRFGNYVSKYQDAIDDVSYALKRKGFTIKRTQNGNSSSYSAVARNTAPKATPVTQQPQATSTSNPEAVARSEQSLIKKGYRFDSHGRAQDGHVTYKYKNPETNHVVEIMPDGTVKTIVKPQAKTASAPTAESFDIVSYYPESYNLNNVKMSTCRGGEWGGDIGFDINVSWTNVEGNTQVMRQNGKTYILEKNSGFGLGWRKGDFRGFEFEGNLPDEVCQKFIKEYNWKNMGSKNDAIQTMNKLLKPQAKTAVESDIPVVSVESTPAFSTNDMFVDANLYVADDALYAADPFLNGSITPQIDPFEDLYINPDILDM